MDGGVRVFLQPPVNRRVVPLEREIHGTVPLASAELLAFENRVPGEFVEKFDSSRDFPVPDLPRK